MLRIGHRGDDTRNLQQKLKDAGYRLSTDGIFGPATDAAVRRFQRDHGLVADGVAGPKTMAAFDGDDPKLLSQADIERAARELDAEVAAVMAVNEVESSGNGFLPDGRVKILFERHWMRRQLMKRGIDPEPWMRKHPNIVSASTGGYQGGAREHHRLKKAKSIDVESAICSASWGAYQIMGFHYETLGYRSPMEFEAAMKESEGKQLDAFVRFIKADRNLHRALQRLDWQEVARRYNGPAFAKNAYDKRMQAAYDRHSTALESTA